MKIFESDSAAEKNSSIKILSPDEARKIAAGEVIDRPAAIVRELLDNAVDSGANQIEVSIEGGGIDKIRVNDNGKGMSRRDLEICWLPHATSKIRSLDDLLTTKTLGFRGEALAAVSAVSKLEIISSCAEGEAYRLATGPGELHPPQIEITARTRGTNISSSGLFNEIPARRRFLKSKGSEAALCKTIFNEKALAWPKIEFRFIQDGKLTAIFQAESSFKKRFCEIYFSKKEEIFIHEIETSGEGFNAVILAGGPEISRSDRRKQLIFANGRRIQDYPLMQAIEYGTEGWFPNGIHPAGAVILNVDPAFADFNVHPAKSEVRFSNPAIVHHAVSSAIKYYFLNEAKNRNMPDFSFNSKNNYNYDKNIESLALTALDTEENYSYQTENSGKNRHVFDIKPGLTSGSGKENTNNSKHRINYLGRIFDLFILAEKNDTLYIIDQHAAHERILYDELIRGPVEQQNLLAAISFNTENADEDLFLREKQNELKKLGITIMEESGGWLITALPAGWTTGDKETVKEILNLKKAGKKFQENWLASLSCKKAVKDGDYLDPETALLLAEETLNLPIPRCPHGRPVFFELKHSEMLKAVKRI